ncbi:MAG: nitroreductase family protein [Actinobacteria bacterium]|nr:nitroreductase family protein [Actinomycetota bacterium]
MELLEGIRTRRAIRKFKDKPVPNEVIERAIENAKWAPVAPPFRQWEYAVATNATCSRLATLINANSIHLKHMLDTFGEKERSRIIEYYRTLGNSRCLVFVTIPSTDDQWERKYKILSVALELQLFLINLHAEGLGACGLTIPLVTEEKILKILGLEGRELVVGFTLGYPDESPEPVPRERAKITFYDD